MARLCRKFLIIAVLLALPRVEILAADFEMGQRAIEEGDTEKAIRVWRAAAIAGDSKAQGALGALYFFGEKVKWNVEKARKWLSKAAASGNPDSQTKLGYIVGFYDKPPDWSKARSLWEKAERGGDGLAHFYLGMTHERGLGIKRNPEQALAHYRLAAEAGVAVAQNRMGSLYKRGKVVPLRPAIAVSYWRRAVAQNYGPAEYNLGNAYRKGFGVARDYDKAAALFKKSAEKGYAMGMYRLGGLYARGEGVKKDQSKAILWFERAAAKGLKYAQYTLGVAYRTGRGVEQDELKAMNWFQLAANQGHKKSIAKLAELDRPSVVERGDNSEKAHSGRSQTASLPKIQPERSRGVMPKAGPSVSYKGRTLIGSTYPDADNEEFFKVVKKAIDLTAELPKELQRYVRKVDTVIYDPPSKHRKMKGVFIDIVGVYTIQDLRKKAPVIVYKDLRYSSPLQVSMSLLGGGLHATRHLRAIKLLKAKDEIDSGKRNASADEKRKIEKEIGDFVSIINKSDDRLVNKAECNLQIVMHKADKAFGIGQQKISARINLINERKCW